MSTPFESDKDLKTDYGVSEAVDARPTNGNPKERVTFATAGVESFYVPIDSYEGRHRYDPKFEWEPAEERKVVMKVCLMFFALQLDRGNISQALSDNMLKDLKMNTNDYNYGQAIFYLCFLFAEVPSQLVSKKIGPDNWIPIQMVSWSLVVSMQAFLSGRSSFCACRALLGLIEGGFIPDNILYLSYFYTGFELPARLSWFWVSYWFTQIVSAFFAYGVLHLRGHNGMERWRWLFALEGMLTGVIGIISYFYLPPSPTQTASRFRGKGGWFNEREEKIMVNRILRDDPSKGDIHNRQAISFRMFWDCLQDYHMWPIYLIGLTWLIPSNPMTAYLTLQLKAISFSTFETNLLTIPAYTLFIIQLLLWTWIWALPLVVALELVPADASHWAKYALSILLVGQPYVHAILVAITSRNAGTAGNIISQNIYRDDDKPLYRRGNKVLIAICYYNFVQFLGVKWFYVWVNEGRGGMSQEEKEKYLQTTKDKGNKRLEFRFAH
ncbi:MFS general substrate transporter [Mytilinidion resinicola]|uniref:MFS general substrate transporter n=1 Tax=Mytilinidion resinicola TaxID=574789 RepID=A0A6A6YIZ4_9PEZI|nr:MFS general substrate transporter [Mytilinidion resinicola]KAF2808771.1 MFS general substrate transporter [Mytilinidion resinicola]